MGHRQGSDLDTLDDFISGQTVHMMATINGAHTEGFNGATSLGVSGFLVGQHTLSKIALAVIFTIEELLVEDLTRTAALGNAMFVEEVVQFGSRFHNQNLHGFHWEGLVWGACDRRHG